MKEYTKTIELRLETERNAMKKVEPYLFDLKQKLNVKDDVFYNLLIAVSEAVNNAVFHGNKLDKTKQIYVKIEVENRHIDIIVTDEGKGFDINNVGDPREPENLLKSHGRGVFLINELSDKVSYKIESSGVTVLMTFFV
jgi:serine/threonine-protein kinase RsbW